MSKIKSIFLTNLLLAIGALVVIVYFYPHTEANHFKFEEGRPWNYAKLIAPFDIPIRPDSASILKVKDSLDNSFVPVFQRKSEIVDTVITSLMSKWNQTDAETLTPADAAMRRRAISYLKKAYQSDIISDEYARKIEDGSLPQVKLLEQNTVRQMSSADIVGVDKLLSQLIAHLRDTTAELWVEKYKIYDELRPNFVYNQEASERLYDYELYRYTAIKGVIQQGQTIIDKGAIITPQDYTNLMTYEQMVDEQLTTNRGSNWLIWFGQTLYVGLLLIMLMAFIYFSAPEIWRRAKSVGFVLLLICIFFLIGIGTESFVDYGMYLVPFAIVPILMIVFFNPPTALFTSMVLVLLLSGTISFSLEFIFIELSAAVAAVYSLKELTKRLQLMRTSLIVALAYWAAYAALELMLNGSFEGISLRIMAYLGVSALLSSMAYIVMVLAERTFGFVSVVTLIELSDVNNPVLRKLSEECPGTFQHSMAVSTLATDAAIKIGANEQLVRAGALYHDIGKIRNPNFFTENQRGVNPHDALPPDRSAQIIVGHVTDGIAEADKAGLPGVIKDFIREHHGAGKAKYFYITYCNAHPGEEIDPTPFTYPGPNPRSRETSLLMMADSVEAASRSLKEHTPEAIRDLVNRIIDQQVADGLHNDSSLSFRDVNIIKEEFIRRLMTIYHSRIVYPEAPKTA